MWQYGVSYVNSIPYVLERNSDMIIPFNYIATNHQDLRGKPICERLLTIHS